MLKYKSPKSQRVIFYAYITKTYDSLEKTAQIKQIGVGGGHQQQKEKKIL